MEKWQRLSTVKPKKGERLYLQNIYITKEHNFGPVNLIVEWRAKEDHPRYIVLDQKADRHAWRRGRKRFWIEPTFRQDAPWIRFGKYFFNSFSPHQQYDFSNLDYLFMDAALGQPFDVDWPTPTFGSQA